MFISGLQFNIFIAEDLALKGKSTYFEAVVKSSNIITGRLLNIPSFSFVYPRINVLPAVKTGVLYSLLYFSFFTKYFVGCSYINKLPNSSSPHLSCSKSSLHSPEIYILITFFCNFCFKL